MQTYESKRVVITGGASGIGLALAKAFGSEGARVLIGEPDRGRLEAAAERLSSAGVDVSVADLDVRDAASMEAFAETAWERFGGVDLLINNAGISAGPGSLTKLPLEDLRNVFDVNVFGVWHGCASFGRRMIEAGAPAAIYNVGSENSFFNAMPKLAAYIATKHAVRGLTEALREEVPDFMTVGLICPGFVKSELTEGPFGALAMDADVFAAKVVEQVRQGQFYVVTHPYNIERIRPVHEEIEVAYATHAPRYEGDDEHDVRRLLAAFRG